MHTDKDGNTLSVKFDNRIQADAKPAEIKTVADSLKFSLTMLYLGGCIPKMAEIR